MKKQLILKPGREKSVLQKHPWIFSGAIQSVKGDPAAGEVVDVLSSRNEWLCTAAYSPASQIRARIWSWTGNEEIDEIFFDKRIKTAIQLRNDLGLFKKSDAVRLIHGESDCLPGLIADLYKDTVVLQSLSAGVDQWKPVIARLLQEKTSATCVLERSDVEVRKLEGLQEQAGVLLGKEPEKDLTILETGLRFLVDVLHGQKTGFYLDQRDNRILAGSMAQGRRILNCFSYTGGFTVHTLTGGAEEVLSIDSSAEALETARKNLELNDLPSNRAHWMEADVFQALRNLRDRAEKFDMIILDPPKFAPTAAHAAKAARAYKDINLLAFKMLNPGGVLFTFSCSGGISQDLFQKIVAGAALDAGVHARITHWMTQAADHPVGLNFPEGYYLKGLVCEVL
ncbi:class I SAM-dependent rRNA methyltransferase [Leptolinea tardivitalis]|uniref:23S rRNA methyltransferase n=1 Tax=Leptolinea tardivitalis TaxID=229920 RepID=A0A0N8GL18_9CHLR|nr:class I SAM-dependent methyltransferase [Leptolinea tardivitalis]KPL71258.1 23S rRNA methyltransferase [Leptolinea tardivitalis]GAP23022.1 predicted SAM-dependent methyltransferases [Leptolinea tardivitalis]